MVLVAAPVALQAQDRGLGIAGNAGVFIPGGDDFTDLDSGFGAEGVLSWGWASGFEIGAGFRLSTHDAGDDDTAPEEEGADLTGIFGEAGWRFNSRPVNSAVVMPFVKARGGYLRADSDSTDEETDDLNGWSLGGQAGLEVWLSRAFAITGAATVDLLSLEEAEAGEGRLTGSLVGITGGVKIRLN
jgi:hypothetical protein